MQSSLANLDFGEQSITIYGTQNDPLIKCSDILIHVLGYKQCKDAGWFRKMADNSKYVTMVNHHDVAATQQVYTNRMFTERGIYTALMKSNKPIAEQFQDQVCDLLKKIRLQTIQQLEEAKQKYESSKKVGYIYGLKHKKYGTIDYAGFTTNTIKERLDSHYQDMTKAIKLPFYKCLMIQAMQAYEIIELQRVEYYDEQELRDRELYHQLFHESIQSDKKLKCHKCKRDFQKHKSFEKHRAQCYGVTQ